MQSTAAQVKRSTVLTSPERVERFAGEANTLATAMTLAARSAEDPVLAAELTACGAGIQAESKRLHAALSRHRSDQGVKMPTRDPDLDVVVGHVTVNAARRTAHLRDTRLALSNMEFSLLLALVREPDRVFTKEQLLREVWGYETAFRSTRTLDSHAARLRQKLGVQGDRFVINVWGVGYRLVDSLEARAA